jgi:hypothetical protein
MEAALVRRLEAAVLQFEVGLRCSSAPLLRMPYCTCVGV